MNFLTAFRAVLGKNRLLECAANRFPVNTGSRTIGLFVSRHRNNRLRFDPKTCAPYQAALTCIHTSRPSPPDHQRYHQAMVVGRDGGAGGMNSALRGMV